LENSTAEMGYRARLLQGNLREFDALRGFLRASLLQIDYKHLLKRAAVRSPLRYADSGRKAGF
jgi:hypothetical protein